MQPQYVISNLRETAQASKFHLRKYESFVRRLLRNHFELCHLVFAIWRTTEDYMWVLAQSLLLMSSCTLLKHVAHLETELILWLEKMEISNTQFGFRALATQVTSSFKICIVVTFFQASWSGFLKLCSTAPQGFLKDDQGFLNKKILMTYVLLPVKYHAHQWC